MTAHGLRSTYVHGCRCGVCRAANSDYGQRYAAARRAKPHRPIDPVKAKAGHIGSAKRWGGKPSRRLWLGDLTAEQREKVYAFVESLRTGWKTI